MTGGQSHCFNEPSLEVQVTCNDTHFQFKQLLSSFKSYSDRDLEFNLGQKFQHPTVDGRTVVSIVTLDDDGRLIQQDTATKPDQKDTTLIREINEEGDLVMNYKVDDVIYTRIYQRIS
ncbi:cellular retinoic acid-binding protein 2-like [Patiria miniata]|uniref:Lipocalin/cytosolic fatty-acid binding domain-containing protein n=1 Tax=Patiria miniata TaxID=46514 RepID=A0A914A7J0_PATMI|nr:cellular retinoic acid-binding protein 2-like [Patiria miniata]